MEGDLPATAHHPVNRCGLAQYTDLRNDTLNDELSEFMDIPRITYNQTFNYNGTSYYRGVYYEGNADYYYFEYMVNAGDGCPIGVEAWTEPGQVTLCYVRADA